VWGKRETGWQFHEEMTCSIWWMWLPLPNVSLSCSDALFAACDAAVGGVNSGEKGQVPLNQNCFRGSWKG
jgi:hypothetical protein